MTKRLAALMMIFTLAIPFTVLAEDSSKPDASVPAAAASTVSTDATAPATDTSTAPADTTGAATSETETEPIATPDISSDVGGFVEQIVKAFNAKDWGIFAGLIIMALVWILKKFVWKSLPVVALPWVSAGTGVVVAVATGLIAGLAWWKAILNGLTVGTAASGLWSLVGKKIFGKNEK